MIQQKVRRLLKICDEARVLIDEIEEYTKSHQVLDVSDRLEFLEMNARARTRMLSVCKRNDINTVNDLLKVNPNKFMNDYSGVGPALIRNMQRAIFKQFKVHWK